MDSAYKRLLKVTTLFGSVQGLNILMNLIRAKLAAMLLGPAGIGLNSIYNETREFIHSTTNLGMDQSGTREIAKSTGAPDLADSVTLTRSWIILLAVFGMLATAVFAYPLSWMLFSDGDHTWQIVALSPAVAFSTLTCGELTVLRGLQQMKTIAGVSVLHVVLGVITTIPLYYIWGMDGIIGALVLMTLSLAIVTMIYSYRIHPPKFCFVKAFLAKGRQMLVLGMSFVIAGFIANLGKLAVKAYINVNGSLDDVGLYSAGLTLTLMISNVVFASLENEFYPRLSSIFTDKTQRYLAIVRQMKVGLAIIIPITIVAIVLMPWIVPILLSDEFSTIVPMAQIASLGLIFRALYLPAALVPMAAGESKIYLLLQAVSYVSFVPAVILGYHFGGITGTGIGLLVNHFMDVVVNMAVLKWRYL
jgi:O-antigen/teichoic acid export membrane protein